MLNKSNFLEFVTYLFTAIQYNWISQNKQTYEDCNWSQASNPKSGVSPHCLEHFIIYFYQLASVVTTDDLFVLSFSHTSEKLISEKQSQSRKENWIYKTTKGKDFPTIYTTCYYLVPNSFFLSLVIFCLGRLFKDKRDWSLSTDNQSERILMENSVQ